MDDCPCEDKFSFKSGSLLYLFLVQYCKWDPSKKSNFTINEVSFALLLYWHREDKVRKFTIELNHLLKKILETDTLSLWDLRKTLKNHLTGPNEIYPGPPFFCFGSGFEDIEMITGSPAIVDFVCMRGMRTMQEQVSHSSLWLRMFCNISILMGEEFEK